MISREQKAWSCYCNIFHNYQQSVFIFATHITQLAAGLLIVFKTKDLSLVELSTGLQFSHYVLHQASLELCHDGQADAKMANIQGIS